MHGDQEETMDKIAEVPEIDEFLAGPLVTWFSSCVDTTTDETVNYDSLVNGYLMHNVFLQMNLQVHDNNVYPSTVDSAAWRSRNLIAVLNNIRRFYEDELNQAILCLPDVEKLGREPEHHVREIELLLALLLGCAVQCPNKQGFIEKITILDQAKQSAVAEFIAQVIEIPGIVLSTEMFVDPPRAQKVIDLLRQLHHEKDDYEKQLHLHREQKEEQQSDDLCEKLQLKYKVSTLEEQLRQKNDELDDMQVELKEYQKKLCDLTKNYEILELEAKNVKVYRDVLDEATASAEKAERLEHDIVRYKKKLAEFDWCRGRLKELEKSNKILTESKAAMEKQITLQKAEREKSRDLKKQVGKLTQQVDNLMTENLENRNKYSTICKEKTEMQRIIKESGKKLRENRPEGIPSMKDDLLLNQANTQIAKLQSDNQSLTSFIATLKQTLFDKSDQVSILTRENKKLSMTIDTLNVKMNSVLENYNREANRSKNLEYICNVSLNEATKLQQQGLEHVKSLLENAQKRLSSSDKNMPKNIVAETNKSINLPKVEKEQKYNVVPSRKLLKYVKMQS